MPAPVCFTLLICHAIRRPIQLFPPARAVHHGTIRCHGLTVSLPIHLAVFCPKDCRRHARASGRPESLAARASASRPACRERESRLSCSGGARCVYLHRSPGLQPATWVQRCALRIQRATNLFISSPLQTAVSSMACAMREQGRRRDCAHSAPAWCRSIVAQCLSCPILLRNLPTSHHACDTRSYSRDGDHDFAPSSPTSPSCEGPSVTAAFFR